VYVHDRRAQVLPAKGSGSGQSARKFFLHELIYARDQGAVALRLKEFVGNLSQLFPVVPVANAALHRP
jgi:hypothetical protein